MPVAPRKICRHPGCSVLTEGAYCDKHEIVNKKQVSKSRIKYDNTRGSASKRGYDYKWRKYSKQYRLENPLCVMCEKEGRLTLAECVDHKKAVTGPDDPLFWEPTNHQGLCHKCHSVKTALEDGAFGNTKRERFL